MIVESYGRSADLGDECNELAHADKERLIPACHFTVNLWKIVRMLQALLTRMGMPANVPVGHQWSPLFGQSYRC